MINEQLDYLQEELEAEIIWEQYLNEGFGDLSVDKLKRSVVQNTSRLNQVAFQLGLDIGKVTSRDIMEVEKILRSGFDAGQDVINTTKRLFVYLVHVLRRAWTPKKLSGAERITSTFFLFVIGFFMVLFLNTFIARVGATLLLKFKSGPKAVIVLLARTILAGPITEELFKRFMIKKFGIKPALATSVGFAGFEWFRKLTGMLKRGMTRPQILLDLLARIFFHTYTTAIQSVGMKIDEMRGDDKRTFEFYGFVTAVAIHAILNIRYMGAKRIGLDMRTMDTLSTIWNNKAEFVQ